MATNVALERGGIRSPGSGDDALHGLLPRDLWDLHATSIDRIRRLKRERGAVILAHAYQAPEIFLGVADLTGDSLALARQAAASDADVLVVCGVHFMAETAAILNPGRTVLIPDLGAGCSLADSITAADVRALREANPGVPVVTYVNTSAEVKAEADVCCTSANAVAVVQALGAERVIFLPDEYLGRYVAGATGVDVVLWHGRCEVHERFTAATVRAFRRRFPEAEVLAHPECAPEVLAVADVVGSTGQMAEYLERRRPRQAVLLTERSMGDNLAALLPDVELIRPEARCPHMKRITLAGIVQSLERLEHRVEVEPVVAGRARRAVERMLEVGRGAQA